MTEVHASHGLEPYLGLRPYGVEDADRFFGRAKESWELASLVLSSRLVVVYGPPGIGKTSLLQAGVLARLDEKIAHVLPIATLPPASMLTMTADGGASAGPPVNPFVDAISSAWTNQTTADDSTIPTLLGGVEVAPDAYGETTRPLVAIVDQLDEIFSAGPDWATARDDFLGQIERAVRQLPHLHLVLSMRQDVMGDVLLHETRLSRGNRRRYRVEPLRRDEALEAITRPLEATPRSFAPGVAEAMVERLATMAITNEVGEQRTVTSDTVDPTNLQIVCLALWRTLPDDVVTITTEHITDHADVDAILTSFCLRAVIDVSAAEGLPEPALWEWLETTFVTDLGTRGTAYEGIASTGAMPKTVARAFEQHRILRAEKRSGSVWFELMHDVLIEPIRRGRRLCEGLAAMVGTARGPDIYLRMAELARRDGLLPLATEYARGAMRAGAHDPIAAAEANLFLGDLVVDQGRAESGRSADELFAEAESHYRQAAELFDTGRNTVAVGRVLAALGRLLIERGRFADAVSELGSALDRMGGDAAVRLDFARALNFQGLPRAALGAYTAVLAHASTGSRDEQVEALIQRGIIGAQHDDAAAALRDLDHAIRLRPELVDRPDVVAARRQAVGRLEPDR
jgi:hypothetical protein